MAERAGLSRGVLNHHFASKEDLVVHSVEELLHSYTEEIRALAAEVRDGRLSFDGFLDRLWEMFSGRLFLITLEHITEARHNDALRQSMVPVVREFHAALDETWRNFFGRSHLSDGEIETALSATLCLLRGMGVQTVLRDDPAYHARLLTWWKGQLALLVRLRDGRPD
ncbi:TetR/AcrR family transcriptional regulator [Chelatococcus sp. SYSU_G07232]|uniref:TetR/AcrR family transcriptional regulator n=1 Tax=Chelatococcus albus TaxID=3047466 RepID=A0ABT7AEX2_9HYPH|nr:TetR/AcrR family transcriptional regulator [Chelatococcus sp. SYSU_G07232]MDJ1157537.1 TetR/AcrR family transcriptional regulator [Chelatococcus sp. SYSU_G07232]